MLPVVCVGGFTEADLAAVRNAGFTRVEISLSEVAAMDGQTLDAYAALLGSLGLTAVAANCFFPQKIEGMTGFFDGSYDENALDHYVGTAMEKTARFPLTSIGFGSGGMRRVTDSLSQAQATEKLRDILRRIVLPRVAERGAILAVEPLNARVTDFLNTCAEGAAFVRTLDDAHAGLLCDFFHLTHGGETPADIPSFRDTLRHVHIASPSNGNNVPLSGDGDTAAYASFVKALAANGYDGFVSVEGLFPKDRSHADALADAFRLLQSLPEITT